MNAMENCYRGYLSMPINGRLLVVSLGLLMSGMAHGAAEGTHNEKCSDYLDDEGASPELILECAQVRREGAYYYQAPEASTDEGAGKETTEPRADTPDEHTNTPPASASTENATGNDSAEGNGVDKAADTANDEAEAASGDDDTSADASDNGSETADDSEKDDTSEAEDDSQSDEDTSAEQRDKVVAVDRRALQVDGAVSGPDNPELFNVDIETAESAEGERPSVAQRDLFNLGFATHRTSDDYKAHSYLFSYRNHRRDWFWPWQESTDRGLDWGLDVERTKGDSGTTGFTGAHAQGMLGGYLNKGTYLQAQAGRHDLETDVGDRAITTHHGTAMFGLDRRFSMQLDTGRDFIYSGGSVKGGITKQLTAQDHSVSFRWRPEERIRLQGMGGFRKYDDSEENIARNADISVLYGVSPGWPWIWAGIGAQMLRYDHEVADYWSPNRFTAYGPRFESSFPLLERLSASAAANLNRQGENGTHGYGYDVSGGFQYRLYQQVYLRLDMSKSKSLQNGNTWKSDNVMFTLSGPLF